MDKLLKSIYYNPSHPGSYGSVNKLYNATSGKYSRSQISKWLQHQETYTLHRKKVSKFKRARYYVPGIDHLFQVDLCDMRNLRQFNDNHTFILTVICVFSKKAWAIPLRDKSNKSVINAMQKVFNERICKYLQSDRGKEFTGTAFQSFLRQNGVKFYTCDNPDIKCSIIERFNRSLKSRMWKYFSHASTNRYIDVLDKLVDSYNKTVHSAINVRPIDVNKHNEKKVYDYLYSGNGRYRKHLTNNSIPKHKVGDLVRITREKYLFSKGYETNFSLEIFEIYNILERDPIRYKIKDLGGEEIGGSFYEQEIQKVLISKNTKYKIDKIIKYRGAGVSRQALVHWLGYPEKFATWIPVSELNSL